MRLETIHTDMPFDEAKFVVGDTTEKMQIVLQELEINQGVLPVVVKIYVIEILKLYGEEFSPIISSLNASLDLSNKEIDIIRCAFTINQLGILEA